MKKLFFLPIIISLFFLTSCEKDNCKECAIAIEILIDGYEADLSSFTSMYPTEELCDDELDTAEAFEIAMDEDGDGENDVRLYYDCN